MATGLEEAAPTAVAGQEIAGATISNGNPLVVFGDFAELLESARAIGWRADAATLQPTFVSNTAQTLLGYPNEEWLKPIAQ